MEKHVFTLNPEYEIATSSIVKAPIELAFKAWTDPNHLINWWGPHGFTNTFIKYDLRPGGRWRYIMHGPDKGNYSNEVEFIRIEKPDLLYWKRHSKPLFRVLTTFERQADQQTKIDFKMLFDRVLDCAKLRPLITQNNEENFDRLELELEKISL